MRQQTGVRLFLLGRFAAEMDCDPPKSIRITGKKHRALLAYLAMHPEKHASREHLASLLWCDCSDALARHSLRQCLALLRSELQTSIAEWLVLDRDSVRLRTPAFAVDALEFAELADAGGAAALERAVDLYRGPFLAEFCVEAEPFDDWVRAERSRLETLAADLFTTWAEHSDALGDGTGAIKAVERLVAIDPLREDWQRRLLRLYARYRSVEAAAAHSRALTALLKKELDVAPMPATTALVADILRGAIVPAVSSVAENAHTLNATKPAPAGSTDIPLPAGKRQGQSRIKRLSFRKPSIGVLPFIKMCQEFDGECFANGIMIDIITALSCVRSVSVVAFDPGFMHKRSAPEIGQVGRELGVDYVLAGSVRRAESRVRVTVHLVDARTGEYIWARRYDGGMSNVWAVQDEISAKVAAAVEPHIFAAESIRAGRQPEHTLDARGCVMRALSLINIRSRQNYAAAEALLKRATDLDPDCARAYSLLAYVTALDVVYGWKPREDNIALACDAAHKAVLLDVDDPWGHLALGFVHAQSRFTEEAIREYEKALALNPNFSLAHTYLGAALSHLGRTEEALTRIDAAERLGPREIFFGVNDYVRANAYFAAERYRDASAFARRSVLQSPGIVTSHRQLVVNSALAGEIQKAKAALKPLLLLVPGSSLSSINEALPYVRDKDRSRFLDAFFLVGVE
jgi:TolB-like protein/DNA-binding SARP family transcriptional activator/Flp pilus assembly protein TadD